MQLENVDGPEAREAGIQTAFERAEGMIDERLAFRGVPVFAEFRRDRQLAAFGSGERFQKTPEALFAGPIGRRGIEVADAELESIFEQGDGIAIRRDFAGHVPPGAPDSDESQPELFHKLSMVMRMGSIAGYGVFGYAPTALRVYDSTCFGPMLKVS